MLHERVVLVNVGTECRPRVSEGSRVRVEDLGQGFYRVSARVGFMQDPDVPSLLREAAAAGLHIDAMQASYFLGREIAAHQRAGRIAPWRKALFAFLSRNARPATHFFALPPNRVVELGAQVEL